MYTQTLCVYNTNGFYYGNINKRVRIFKKLEHKMIIKGTGTSIHDRKAGTGLILQQRQLQNKTIYKGKCFQTLSKENRIVYLYYKGRKL